MGSDEARPPRHAEPVKIATEAGGPRTSSPLVPPPSVWRSSTETCLGRRYAPLVQVSVLSSSTVPRSSTAFTRPRASGTPGCCIFISHHGPLNIRMLVFDLWACSRLMTKQSNALTPPGRSTSSPPQGSIAQLES